MKYVFNVKEISYGCIEVEAETEEQAREIADEQYSMGNTIWRGGEYEITDETKKPPVKSPWGEIDNLDFICNGVYSVSTASHGGIMFEERAAKRILSDKAQEIGVWDNSFLCFEEDCASTVALRELMDKHLFEAPVDDYFPAGRYEYLINRAIKEDYPEYWAYHQSNLPNLDRGDER